MAHRMAPCGSDASDLSAPLPCTARFMTPDDKSESFALPHREQLGDASPSGTSSKHHALS